VYVHIVYSSDHKRTGNFSPADKQLLFDIVLKFPVIDNKMTDAVTSRQKQQAWDFVAAEFNAVSSVKRSSSQLKQVRSLTNFCECYLFLLFNGFHYTMTSLSSFGFKQ